MTRQRWYLVLLALLVAAALGRSLWATRLDGLTIDEPWHIAAGVSYVKTGDYRLNGEQGPLVKLWVGSFLARDFRLPPFRPIADKHDERHFTEQAVFLDNDPGWVQRRARLAMLSLSAVLLILFAWISWRTLGPEIAVGAVLCLAIDPTVAAHMPVVMMDFTTGMLSVMAVLTAVHAFCTGRAKEFLLASVVLGLAIGTKNSALITGVFVAGIGVLVAARTRKWQPLAWTVAMSAVSVTILWALYGFRYAESQQGGDLFNRPLLTKIADLHTASARQMLTLLEHFHLLPRSFLWGLADTIRDGIEGHSIIIHAFGRIYDSTPWYMFPGLLMVKIPLGLIALGAAGIILFLSMRSTSRSRYPLLAIGVFALLQLIELMGSSAYYAGVRHSFATLIIVAIFSGVAFEYSRHGSGFSKAFVVVAFVAAAASALPVTRPWEYHNELAGSTADAYRYFSNEGVDLGQRSQELINYYDTQLRPKGEVPYLLYDMSEEELERHKMKVHSYGSTEDAANTSTDFTGTFIVSTIDIALTRRDDYAVLRNAKPVARFGNMLVYRGTFHLPEWRAWCLYMQGLNALYANTPDYAEAERLFEKVLELRPMMVGSAVDLGNLAAKRGDRQTALRGYRIARDYTSLEDGTRARLEQQIAQLATSDPRSLAPVRNPWME